MFGRMSRPLEASQTRGRIEVVVTEAHVQVAPVDVDVVDGERRRPARAGAPSRCSSAACRAAASAARRPGRKAAAASAPPRSAPRSTEIGSPTRKNVPSGLRIPVALLTANTASVALAARVNRGKQHVRVGVAEILVDAPAAANDVASVAAHVVGKADARLDVVAVLLRVLAEVVDTRRREPSGGARRLQHDEVRIQRLIDRHAVDVVVAQAEVERQPVGDAPVVLDVERRTA